MHLDLYCFCWCLEYKYNILNMVNIFLSVTENTCLAIWDYHHKYLFCFLTDLVWPGLFNKHLCQIVQLVQPTGLNKSLRAPDAFTTTGKSVSSVNLIFFFIIREARHQPGILFMAFWDWRYVGACFCACLYLQKLWALVHWLKKIPFLP